MSLSLPSLRRSGFTLLEMLVVLVVIGILVGLSLPRFGYLQEKAYVAAMQSDLRNFAVSHALYIADAQQLPANTAEVGHHFSPSVFEVAYQGPAATQWSLLVGHEKTDVRCALSTIENGERRAIACAREESAAGFTANVSGTTVHLDASATVASLSFAPEESRAGAALAAPRRGGIAYITWEFGDGEVLSGSPEEVEELFYTYAEPGTYTVQITTVKANGRVFRSTQEIVVESPVTEPVPAEPVATDPVTTEPVNTAPRPSFFVDPTIPETGEEIWLTSTSHDAEGDALTYAWTVGGASYTGSAIRLTFSSPGSYPVRLVVTDEHGLAGTLVDTVTVEQANRAPTADFAVSTASPQVGTALTFAATASDLDGDALSYVWNFGDGSATAVGRQVSHTYAAAATYTVMLTVSDGQGGLTRVAHTVTVSALPEPEPILSTAPCAPTGSGRLVQVSSASALSSALSAANPGDAIVLADGTYAGQFRITRSGTASAPIQLCGSAAALLKGSSVGSGYGVHMDADYWKLSGFTITNYQFGVYLTGSSHNVLDNLTIDGLGQEGVHFRSFSSDNVLKNSRIRNTGLTNAEYGEGVYIGTYRGQWATYTSGQPDRSDRNQVLNNHFGPNVRAEHIDVKEGTTGGLISGNTMDGTGMVRSQSWVNSLMEIKGNSYTISGNQGVATITDGLEVFQELAGWGNYNTFGSNSIIMQGAVGYGIRITSPVVGNVVSCSNTVSGGSLSNIGCR